jgi:hypothetical protein
MAGMAKWKIPAPLDLGLAMRKKESARISQRVLDDGRLQTVVEHAPMPGVTPAMCLWYLENIDREVELRGCRAIAYRFWHPRDHIHFKRLGKFGVGDTWHIVEAFGAERRWLLDDHFHVTRLDETGFTMEVRVPLLGAAAVAEERWQPSEAGLRWTVTLTGGFASAPRRWLNAAVRKHRLPFIDRWTQHNVEEGGCLPQFLPEMYAERERIFR